MPTHPSARVRERRQRHPPAAAGQTGRPDRAASRVKSIVFAAGMLTPRRAALILLVELVYVSALAFVVPAETGALALAFIATILLATLISRHVARRAPTSANQPAIADLKTREPQRPAPSVRRQRRTPGRREGSDVVDPQGT